MALEIDKLKKRLKELEEALQLSENRYRKLFEDSPVSLWEEDYSEIRKIIQKLKKEKIVNFEEYFDSNPEIVAHCAELVKILDVNQATLKLFKAQSKADLLGNLNKIFTDATYSTFKDELIAIAEGCTECSCEVTNNNLKGETIHYIMQLSISPGYEKSLARVLVSIHDITDRKKAEDSLKKVLNRYQGLFEESPVSLWEEDWSEAKEYFNNLKATGITDFREYFDLNPHVLAKCAKMIKTIDVNKATVRLFKAKSKEELLGNLDKIFADKTYRTFKEELIAMAEGQISFKIEVTNQNFLGDKIHYIMELFVAPEYEASLSRVLLSLLDITAQKRGEVLLRQIAVNEIQVASLKMCMDGPTSCFSERLPFTKDSVAENETLNKVSVFYMVTLGQGNHPSKGLYGPFPVPNVDDRVAMAYSFYIDDKDSRDPRNKGKSYSLIVFFIRETFIELFANRMQISQIMKEKLDELTDASQINIEFLVKLKYEVLGLAEIKQ